MKPIAILLALLVPMCPAAEDVLPGAKPVPSMQTLPLPHDQASLQRDGKELTRYHFDPSDRRPFCYPIQGPAGRSLTRMGHPHDPVSHSHHNSVWISHHDVGGVDFWGDHGKGKGRIVHQRVLEFWDGEESTGLRALNHWVADEGGRVMLEETRQIEVVPRPDGSWFLIVDLHFALPEGAADPVVFEQTPFGLIGVRMAKTIGTHDGGGRILNSVGAVNEKAVFRKPARWVDYSGPITREQRAGITLMDHPSNATFPSPFHVRGDGWMGICLTLDKAIEVSAGKPLVRRYALWVHAGVADAAAAQAAFEEFAARPVRKPPR